MILERKKSRYQIESEYYRIVTEYGIENEFGNINDFNSLMQVYSGAMREIGTKLENLDEEFQCRQIPNPIHHMESRLKTFESILGKLKKNNLPITLQSIQRNLYDIAGIRVICNYRNDIYSVADMLSKQPDVDVLRTKDYVAHPKPNGYRSFHLICTVPVFLTDGPHVTPVEVQFRTIAMDYWASLEHELRYKNQTSDHHYQQHSYTLINCASQLDEIERMMQSIHADLNEHK